mgnify:FL=1
MKEVARREFLRIVAAAALVCAAASLTGCGKNVEKLVVGDWYLEGSDRLRFTIYDDGTVNIPTTYGTGKWSIVNKDQLKVSDFYGETFVLKIDDIDKNSMTVRQVWEGQESAETITYWHKAEDAVKH